MLGLLWFWLSLMQNTLLYTFGASLHVYLLYKICCRLLNILVKQGWKEYENLDLCEVWRAEAVVWRLYTYK